MPFPVFVYLKMTAFERIAKEDAAEHCAPYIYGYVSYARAGFRDATLRFTNIPATGKSGAAGYCTSFDQAAASLMSHHPPNLREGLR